MQSVFVNSESSNQMTSEDLEIIYTNHTREVELQEHDKKDVER